MRKVVGTRASKAIDGLILVNQYDGQESGFVAKLSNRRVGLFWSPSINAWRIVTKKLLPHRRIVMHELCLAPDTMHELVGLYVAHAQLAGQANGMAWADVPALHAEIERKNKALEQIMETLAEPYDRTHAETAAYATARVALTIGGRG